MGSCYSINWTLRHVGLGKAYWVTASVVKLHKMFGCDYVWVHFLTFFLFKFNFKIFEFETAKWLKETIPIPLSLQLQFVLQGPSHDNPNLYHITTFICVRIVITSARCPAQCRYPTLMNAIRTIRILRRGCLNIWQGFLFKVKTKHLYDRYLRMETLLCKSISFRYWYSCM